MSNLLPNGRFVTFPLSQRIAAQGLEADVTPRVPFVSNAHTHSRQVDGFWNLTSCATVVRMPVLDNSEGAWPETKRRIDVTNPNDRESYALSDHIPVLAVFE